MDKNTGTVIGQENMEGAKDYNDLLQLINISVGSKVVKSIQDPKRAQKASEKFTDIPLSRNTRSYSRVKTKRTHIHICIRSYTKLRRLI
ncbi:MAG: hypothetical protein HYS21_13230 [Deltaproteobacteria bacterium]|nr:hypothetical protein [Deltaproteobacteria bacterium]